MTSLQQLFRPGSIAIVGASDQPDRPGEAFFQGLLAMGFGGPIYPIARRDGTMFDRPVYTRLNVVPGPVDYVISCIPAPQIPDLMRDCAAKEVGLVHLFTADFGETG
ncbi:MAG TPA: CoA-binding protein, partial [Dehalococcoidia bacterium]|nr:CoA-binding protein [Dehalococcoidia bacterium]